MTDINLILTECYPHPIEKVWAAISTREGLEAWLMPNDFELREGHECTFRFCASEHTASDSLVFVRVVDFEEPYRMTWRWRNEDEIQASVVTFRLRETPGGTEFTIEHSGPASAEIARQLRDGWPGKLAALRGYLG